MECKQQIIVLHHPTQDGNNTRERCEGGRAEVNPVLYIVYIVYSLDKQLKMFLNEQPLQRQRNPVHHHLLWRQTPEQLSAFSQRKVLVVRADVWKHRVRVTVALRSKTRSTIKSLEKWAKTRCSTLHFVLAETTWTRTTAVSQREWTPAFKDYGGPTELCCRWGGGGYCCITNVTWQRDIYKHLIMYYKRWQLFISMFALSLFTSNSCPALRSREEKWNMNNRLHLAFNRL